MAVRDTESQTEFRWQKVGNQYLAVFIANIICLGHGTLLGWMSPAIGVLTNPDKTPLKTGALTNSQVSWCGSINSIGAMSGTFTTGILITYFGCKRSMIFLTVPSMLFWILIYLGDTYYHVLIARIFTGWTGGGIQTTLILFTSEIANDSVRGRLGCYTPLARNIGILLAYIVGAAVEYSIIPLIFIIFPILFAIGFTILPNTPQYYLLKGQQKPAESSLKFYKRCKGKNQVEIAALEKELNSLKLVANDKKCDEKITLSDLTNKAAIKGLALGIILAWLTQLTGGYSFVTYGLMIFEKVGVSKIDPYIASITIAVVQIFGSLMTTQLSDTLGRKFLVMASLLGSAFGLFSLALYSYLNLIGHDVAAYDWMPVVCVSFIIFVASAGVVPLAVVCTIENLPSKIRTLGLTIATMGYNVACFTTLKLFPIFMEMIGIHGCMLIYAVSCTLGALYIFIGMEETKGRSLEQAERKVTRVYKKSYGQLPSLAAFHAMNHIETNPDGGKPQIRE